MFDLGPLMYAHIFHGMMFSIQCSYLPGIFTVPIDATGKKINRMDNH